MPHQTESPFFSKYLGLENEKSLFCVESYSSDLFSTSLIISAGPHEFLKAISCCLNKLHALSSHNVIYNASFFPV